MKRSLWFIYCVALLVSVALFGRTTPACAAEGSGVPMDRLERLENRVNEMAERQEQFMRRMSAQMEHQGMMPQPGHDAMRPELPPAGAPPSTSQHPQAAKLVKCLQDTLVLLFLIGVLCNILLATWIFTDIRKRGEGSGIFIALALVAGIPAAVIYTLTRIGDKKA